MLLHRGHGSILSGFFNVFSCSLCSSSDFDTFAVADSFSAESVVVGFSFNVEDAFGSVTSSDIEEWVISSSLSTGFSSG
ncbi:hypothetical protein HanRHA438_Chr07g0317491 [Helianthus annuus]|nr:hypothetical protein HanRHA438_Chr07g0317491 [Helianthus annuus]